MGFDSDIASINGLYYDQTSVRLKIGNVNVGYAVKDVSFSEKITPTVIRDSHPVRAGTGLGMYDADAQLTFTQEVWEIVQPKLFAQVRGDVRALTLLQFAMNVAFIAPGRSRPTTFDLLQCRIIGRGLDGITGSDGITRKIPLTVQQVLEDGIPLAPLRR